MGKRLQGWLWEGGEDPSLDHHRVKTVAKRQYIVSKAIAIPDDGSAGMTIVSRNSVPSSDVLKPSQLEIIPMLLFGKDLQSADSNKVLRAINQLGSLCEKMPTFRVDAVQLGAPSLLLVAMKHQWPHHEAIVAECSRCLFILLAPMRENVSNHSLRLSLLISGASADLTKAIQDFPGSLEVHYWVLCTLSRLFDRCDERTHLAVDQFCSWEGGVTIITVAMSKFRRSKNIQYMGCLLLAKLYAEFPSVERHLFYSEAVDAVDAAMKRHPSIKWIQAQGAEFLKLTCKHSTTTSVVVQVGGLSGPAVDIEKRLES